MAVVVGSGGAEQIEAATDKVETITIGGIQTARVTRRDLAALMLRDFALARSGLLALPKVVVASNGASIAAYHRDAAFRDLLRQADLIDADGMPLVMASRLLCGKPLAERVATTDFIHDAAAAAAAHGVRFYFLGAAAGVAEQAADRLRAFYPALQIVGVRHGYFAREDEDEICAEIRARGTDVLWVGLGTPRQEAFAIRNRPLLAGLTWVRTCGGMFDHCSGRFPRAPVWMQNIGFEWLFRAALEPTRLGRRYLFTNPSALYHLVTKTHD